MDIEIEKKKKAVIVLHEIYGVNAFIQEQCLKFRESGYDVICPDMMNRPPFSYKESEDAYAFFKENISFEVYKEIDASIHKMKETYAQVFVIGFSVGATIAWRCCENSSCAGIISCYGSRIRDYTDIIPACPVLLLFARENSFDVPTLIGRLQDKPHLEMLVFDAEHGFMDPFTNQFDFQQSKLAEDSIARFMKGGPILC